MFGKKSATEIPALKAMNQFGQGTIITGDITTEGDLRVDGKIAGNIISKAKVVIGSTGSIDGNIHCQNAYIDGKVDGNIQVAEMLILSKTAVVNGDITLKKLVVEEGARFNGKCSMGLTAARNEQIDLTSAKPKLASAV